MESPDFIVPPPGLIPSAPPPSEEPDRTVRAAPPRSLPAFAPPPGLRPTAVPGPTPAEGGADAVEERIEAPTPTPQPGAWRLRAPGGLEVLLLRPVVLGRDPSAEATRPDAAPIPLADPARSVSKTHALVEVVDGRVTVTDLHSTNGTRVLTPDGEARELDPGVASEVAGGSTLLLGEFAVRVDRAPLHTV
ncbi:FHA domain-containing protein [Agromyces sp. NPDC004153]